MGDVRIKPKLEVYQNARSASGSKVKISGDQVSRLLEGMTLDEVQAVAVQVVKNFDASKYSKLNPGHQRMCIGNLIRGASKGDGFNISVLENAHEATKERIATVKAAKEQEAADKKVAREAKAAAKAEKKAAEAAKPKEEKAASEPKKGKERHGRERGSVHTQ
jgi:NADH dehydrogenase/NADH:ubiquinone oxidoreductase subunit G